MATTKPQRPQPHGLMPGYLSRLLRLVRLEVCDHLSSTVGGLAHAKSVHALLDDIEWHLRQDDAERAAAYEPPPIQIEG